MATVRQCEQAIEQHGDRLSGFRNVVGLGIQPLSDEHPRLRQMAVAVYVTRKLPEGRLAARDRIPPEITIHARGRALRVPTRVIEQGEVELEGLD